jgi:hypothetical protein
MSLEVGKLFEQSGIKVFLRRKAVKEERRHLGNWILRLRNSRSLARKHRKFSRIEIGYLALK